MAIPNYSYLKLKMPGPNGVITVRTTYQHAYECDVECCEYTEAIIESEALAAAGSAPQGGTRPQAVH
jgi:hypothetical protein